MEGLSFLLNSTSGDEDGGEIKEKLEFIEMENVGGRRIGVFERVRIWPYEFAEDEGGRRREEVEMTCEDRWR